MTGDFAVPTVAFAQAMAGAEREQRRPTPAQAFARAREIYRAGQKLDMGALAADVGVARATLYRWTGDRERLLADVTWAEVESLLTYFNDTVGGTGEKRIIEVSRRVLEALSNNPALRAYLEHEGDGGLQLITAPRGGVRPRIVQRIGEMIEDEVQRGRYSPPAEPVLLADAILSLAERFLYHGGDPARNPDPETGSQAIALLLRE